MTRVSSAEALSSCSSTFGHASSCLFFDVLLSLRPSLPGLRGQLLFLVRLVHRYYGAVRLLLYVHVCRLVYGLRGPVLIFRPRRTGDLPVLVHVVSQRARVLRLRKTDSPLAIRVAAMLPSSYSEWSRHPVPSAFGSSIARPTDASGLRFKKHLAMSPARLEVRMDSLLPFLSSRACGPRKLMKITSSRMQN
jgi:hypothetical protein